ncbi:MAG: hypothetical protein FJX25_02085 [Alphaproteobacteria bacterium]|nr:hypothetical protein [Alphaproteobacteria bacterium]
MRSASILALTGGGIMARFTTRVLEDLQAQRNAATGANNPDAPLREAFDLMAGTSAGALCVGGLVAGRSPADLSRIFDEHGPRIFPPGNLWRSIRWAVTTKYDPRPLWLAVDAALDGRNPRLGELPYRVAFPAVDESEGRPIVLTNADPLYLEVFLRDAVLASAAAPTYFPAHRIEALGRRYVDGGLFANAPDLAALTIARSLFRDLGLEDMHLLSIGTTTTSSRSPFKEGHTGAQGLISWATLPPARLLKLTMRSQVDHAMELLPKLQLADFIRIDARLDTVKGKHLELDNASAEAMKTLIDAGGEAIATLSAAEQARLIMILGRRRAAPV